MDVCATGVNKIPPLQQVPWDWKCPWTQTASGHVAAHIGDFRRLPQHLASNSPPPLTSHSSSTGGANKGSPLEGDAECFSRCKFFRLTRIRTAGDNWRNPLRAVAYYIIFFVHEKRHPPREINSGSSVSPPQRASVRTKVSLHASQWAPGVLLPEAVKCAREGTEQRNSGEVSQPALIGRSQAGFWCGDAGPAEVYATCLFPLSGAPQRSFCMRFRALPCGNWGVRYNKKGEWGGAGVADDDLLIGASLNSHLRALGLHGALRGVILKHRTIQIHQSPVCFFFFFFFLPPALPERRE